MWYNFLTETDTPTKTWESYVLMGALLAIIIVFMFLNRQTQKKRQQETMDMLNAIKPGNKVKTIGGICGVVVEVCPEDNTFILETGSETTGKSYIKFDKKAVYQTDAKKEAPVEEAPAEETLFDGEPVEEAIVEEVTTEVEEAPVETTEE